MGILLWIGSSLASFGVILSSVFDVFKMAADDGYAIDSEELSKIANEMGSNYSKAFTLSMLIPVVNIVLSFWFKGQIKSQIAQVLDQYYVLGALREMTPFEKKQYEKNTTGLNAMITSANYKVSLENAEVIIIDDYFKSEVFFEVGEHFENITILKVTGPLARMSEKEQKDIVNKARYKKLHSKVAELLFETTDPNDIDLKGEPSTIEFLKAIQSEMRKLQDSDEQTIEQQDKQKKL